MRLVALSIALVLLAVYAAVYTAYVDRIYIDPSTDYHIVVSSKNYMKVSTDCRESISVDSSGNIACSNIYPYTISAPVGSVASGRNGCGIYIVMYTQTVQYTPCPSGYIDIYIPSDRGTIPFLYISRPGRGTATVEPIGANITVYINRTAIQISTISSFSCPGCVVVYSNRVLVFREAATATSIDASPVEEMAKSMYNPIEALFTSLRYVGEWSVLALYIFPAMIYIARRSPALAGAAAAVLSMLILFYIDSPAVRYISSVILALTLAASIYILVRGHET